MPTEMWQTPIEIAVAGGDHFKSVQNSREALETLMTCWPEKGGRSFAIAKRACMKSLSGEAEKRRSGACRGSACLSGSGDRSWYPPRLEIA
ncbi:DUF982 domain-containing protein [Rhizobium sp. WYCCWR 11146]|uniref:DUF982 domain-containing protein n=1 Tax=Rhizobium sp. WYCCWR 11146 TaxID=2749833 RepID=UPI001FEEF135|nr:DUF982 domain-containing protein [Rhizobium sp. WYCCWR 11146]